MALPFSNYLESQSLQEATGEKATGGVTHLEHIEDAILLHGSKGIEDAIEYLRKVVEFAANADNSFCVTTKFDGSPAVVTGINPENGKFFVATKALFNKEPKINYTAKDVDRNHPDGGLNSKLKVALQHLKGLGIRGIMQGDFLFTTEDLKTETVEGRRYVTFRPNTLTYAVPANSDLAKEIQGAKMGIVFHTKYTGNSIATLAPAFAPDISYLKKSKSVWAIDANLQGSGGVGTCGMPINSLQKKEIELQLAAISKKGKAVARFLDSISKISGLVVEIMTYTNQNVRQGVDRGSTTGFLKHLAQKVQRDVDKLKTSAAREKKSAAGKLLIDSVKSKSTQYDRLFDLYHSISTTKLLVIERLRQTKMKLDAFTQEDGRISAAPPEGFVVVNRKNNQAFKLVDRLDFSRKNFNLPKNWKT